MGLAVGAIASHASESATVDSTNETTTGKSPTALEEIWTRDKLTGDWGGLRSDLSEHGIDIDLRLSQYGQWVTSGGVNENGEYGGTMDYRINIDGHKLFGTWEGLSVNMHARTRFGEDVNADVGSLALQNTGMLGPLPGDYHGTDITGLLVSQYFPFFGGLGNVTIGKFNLVDTITTLFPQTSYGQEGFWNFNVIVPGLPWFGAVQGLSLYGGMAMTVNEEYKLPQSGFLAFGTKNVSTTTSRDSVSDSFDEGTWLAGFHRTFWEIDNKMGYFLVFAGASTREQASNDAHDFVEIPGQGIESTDEKKPWNVAAYVYQEFWQAEGNPNRKATFFMGVTGGPDNPQFAHWSTFATVEAFGPMASRPDDRMGVSAWYSSLSDNFTDLVSPVADLRDPWGVEIYYNFAINKWLHVSPDLQFIQNEHKGDDVAVIPGVRVVMEF
jgi:porin